MSLRAELGIKCRREGRRNTNHKKTQKLRGTQGKKTQEVIKTASDQPHKGIKRL